MVATMVLEAIAERRASSSLALGTKFIVRWMSWLKSLSC